jgi:hypothetical protein
MNVINRLVMCLLLVIIMIIAALFVLVPQQILNFAVVSFGWMLDWTTAYMNSNNTRLLFAAGRLIGGGLVIIACLILLWLELRQPKKKTVRVQKLTGGEAHIAVDSIEQRLAYNIDQLPDVVNVNPRIMSRVRGVDIDLLLETSPDIDVPMKTEEVMEVTREVIVERMGLKLGKVQVKIKHAPYPKE